MDQPADIAANQSAQPKELLDLTIIDMAYGGKGIARHDGKVYFVYGTVPGDHIEAHVVWQHKRYAEAVVSKFFSRSPLRGTSPCAVSHQCGGCPWIEISYEQQLQWKLQFLKSQLIRIAKIDETFEVAIQGSPALHNYRNRIHLKIERDTTDHHLDIGYYRHGSNDLVAVGQCLIADAAINEFLPHLRGELSYLSITGKIKVEIQVIEASRLLLLFYPDRLHPEDIPALEAWATQLQSKYAKIFWSGLATSTQRSPFVLLDSDHQNKEKYFTRAGLFQQINLAMNLRMRQRVAEIIGKMTKARRILDVCCGSGNFSLQLAQPDRYIEGIESNIESIACAKHNVLVNRSPGHLNYLSGDATKHLWKCARAGEKFDAVILDPPRQGLYEGMIPLKKIAPQKIIYVSCDPATLARDLGTLCRQDYAIESMECFDLFPNTFHVETIAVLSRVNP